MGEIMRYNNSTWKSVYDCDDFEIIENESRYAIRPKHNKIGVGIIGDDGICCRPNEFIDSMWINKCEKKYGDNNIYVPISLGDIAYIPYLLTNDIEHGGDVIEMETSLKLYRKFKKLLEENTINE